MLSRRSLLLAAAPSPTPLAESLSRVYGQSLSEVVYIQTVPLLARLRLGHLPAVESLVHPFLSGERNSLANATPSHLSGHFLFHQLHRQTGKTAYRERLLAAARLAQIPFYNEMSDGVFMGCPLLAAAGQSETARDQFLALQKICQRPDGLWRHSPLNDAAWGRGNAFPLLGLALAMESSPKPELFLPHFQALADALLPHQTPAGLWRQVIDHPSAWEEFSATAMIATSIKKGLRRGWLPQDPFSPALTLATAALNSRISPTGDVTAVCESTGKQTSLAAYLSRKSIRGQDPRGGAFALYFLTEP
jgi:unsaturated rhamnogalacturonyl hydrolase